MIKELNEELKEKLKGSHLLIPIDLISRILIKYGINKLPDCLTLDNIMTTKKHTFFVSNKYIIDLSYEYNDQNYTYENVTCEVRE